MRYMQVVDKEWSDFRNQLERGTAPAGLILVEGASEGVAQQVQSLLQFAHLQGKTCAHFLSSGNAHFRIPSYIHFDEGETVSESIYPLHLMREYFPMYEQPVHATHRLEQRMATASSRPHFVIIECLTPPGRQDLAFISRLVRSSLAQLVPILIIAHRAYQDTYELPTESIVSELLVLLYVCGGRVRAQDWARLIDGRREPGIEAHLFASRQIASETWICYTHRGIAEVARDLYQSMPQNKRTRIAKQALRVLPQNTVYPLLAIAAETDTIEVMQSMYSFKALDQALVEPESVVRYFDALHDLAQQTGTEPLIGITSLCSLISPFYINPAQLFQSYQKAREGALILVDPKIEAVFWTFLGEHFAVMKVPKAWRYATNCLDRGRTLVEHLYQTGKLKKVEWQVRMSSIAKVEALIAYKLGEEERMHQLMEFAIAQIASMESALSYLIDARTNFGDGLLRLSNDPQAAITQYEEALSAMMRASSEARSRLGLGNYGMPRAAQKLGDVLMLVERYQEAIQIFELLLNHLTSGTGRNGRGITQQRLKARQALAQAYLKINCPRSAAACYWLILRQPDWLEPQEAQAIAAQLYTLRPNLHPRLEQRIQAILSLQEQRAMDVTTIQRILSDL